MAQNLEYDPQTDPIPPQTEPEKKSGALSFLLEILQTVVIAVLLYFAIDGVIARVRVENISMQPTLRAGEFLMVNKVVYKLSEYQRGDIIVFHFPPDPAEDYIKRIIGLPGDKVTVGSGKVLVNGHPLEEPYIAADPKYTGTWTVPANSLFVLGDNRNQSSDSHSWGFVPINLVVGKALVIYWPLSQARVLTHPDIVQAAN